MKTIIMVSGKLQAGKNAFSDMLSFALKQEGKDVKQDLFAYDVKKECAKHFAPLGKVLKQIKDGIADDCHENTGWLPMFSENWQDLDLQEENFWEDKTPISRALLQIFGTNIVREMISDRYWIDKIEERTREEDFDFKIITDLRFKNEMDAFKEDGQKVITIRVNREMDRTALENEHESEKDLDDVTSFDYFVDNNGSMEDLAQEVSRIAKEILE